MPNFRTVRLMFLALLACLGFALTACGSESKPAPKPTHDNFLSIVFTNDGEMNVPVQEFFTDKPATVLRLNIVSRGGNAITAGKMFMKIVTVVNITRTDQTSSMSLGTLQFLRTVEDHNTYADTQNFVLPVGTYGFMIDGEMTKEIIKVSPKSVTPSASAR